MQNKKTKFYFVCTYKNSNQLRWYTCTRPWNETKLSKCVIYTLEVKINFEFKKGVGITIKSKETNS